MNPFMDVMSLNFFTFHFDFFFDRILYLIMFDSLAQYNILCIYAL